MITGSLKKKKIKKNFFFFKFQKRGGSLIRACSLIRSNTVLRIFTTNYFCSIFEYMCLKVHTLGRVITQIIDFHSFYQSA